MGSQVALWSPTWSTSLKSETIWCWSHFIKILNCENSSYGILFGGFKPLSFEVWPLGRLIIHWSFSYIEGMAAWETSTFQESEVVESIAALLSSDLSTSKFTLESENTGLWPICFGSKKNYISEKRLVRKCFTCQGRRRGCNRLDGRAHLRGQGAESAVGKVSPNIF